MRKKLPKVRFNLINQFCNLKTFLGCISFKVVSISFDCIYMGNLIWKKFVDYKLHSILTYFDFLSGYSKLITWNNYKKYEKNLPFFEILSAFYEKKVFNDYCRALFNFLNEPFLLTYSFHRRRLWENQRKISFKAFSYSPTDFSKICHNMY